MQLVFKKNAPRLVETTCGPDQLQEFGKIIKQPEFKKVSPLENCTDLKSSLAAFPFDFLLYIAI